MAGQATYIIPEYQTRSKLNNSGVTILKGSLVIADSTEDQIVLPAASTDLLLGAATADIPDGSWGTIQVSGKALVRAAGALATVGIALMPNTSGQCLLLVNGNALAGLLDSAAATANDLVEVELSGPGSFR